MLPIPFFAAIIAGDADANAASSDPPVAQSVTMSPAELFSFAESAARRGDLPTAVAAYRALAADPKIEIRSEARFRLAQLLVSQRQLTDAALLLRSILDEQPGASRVRVELAGVLAMMGDESGARRELRAARAGVLPPEVAQFIDRFSEALRARKPVGGSLQLALASDSNINRATRSDTLGTVIGDFVLNEDAKARSGVGVSLNGQAYGRLSIGQQNSFLVSLSTAATLYGRERFNDVSLGAKAGPELQFGRTQANFSAAVRRRWFGGEPYSTSMGGQLDVTQRVANTTQLRGSFSADHIRNHFNALEDGWHLAGTASLEKALSNRSGAGIALGGIRRALKDPGYSTLSGQATLFGFREFGKLTVSAGASAGRLRADQRMLLFPDRRKEWSLRGTLGLVSRHLAVGGFAPTVQLIVERNHSSIEIYDHRRTALEFGVTRAF